MNIIALTNTIILGVSTLLHKNIITSYSYATDLSKVSFTSKNRSENCIRLYTSILDE